MVAGVCEGEVVGVRGSCFEDGGCSLEAVVDAEFGTVGSDKRGGGDDAADGLVAGCDIHLKDFDGDVVGLVACFAP